MASKKGGFGKAGAKWRSIAQNATSANANSSENGTGGHSASPPGKRGGGKSGKVPFRMATTSNMTNAEPELAIMSLRNPNVKNYRGLRNLIQKSDKAWIEEFLSLHGLGVLLETLNSLTKGGNTHSMTEAIMVIEVVTCIKAVVNSRAGLEFLINSADDATNLIKIVLTSNASVKLQVFELLCAVAIYSKKGHSVVLHGLESMRVAKKLRFRFSFIVDELSQTDVTSYKTTLISFVNCIILGCCEDVKDRIRIRREFKSLGLQKILNELRESSDEGLSIQCQVYDNHEHSDELLAEDQGLDLTSNYHKLFDTLYEKIVEAEGPRAYQFLMLLQNINHWEGSMKQDDVDRLWKILTQLSDPTHPNNFLKASVISSGILDSKTQMVTTATQAGKATKAWAALTRKHSLKVVIETTDAAVQTEEIKETVVDHGGGCKTVPPPPPPPPPPPFSTTGFGPPPPPPMPISMSGSCGPPPPPPPPMPSMPGFSGPPPPPPPPMPSMPGSSGPPPPPPPPMPSMPGSSGPPPPPPPPMPPMTGFSGPPPPPPPPMPSMPGSSGPPPPPPPPMPSMPGSSGPPPPPPPFGSGPPPPPPPFGETPIAPPVRMAQNYSAAPTQSANFLGIIGSILPKPTMKTKKLNWSKLTPQSIESTIWGGILQKYGQKSAEIVSSHCGEAEMLFCEKSREVSETDKPATKAATPTKISLLDSRRSMNIDIFLKQFRMPNQEIVSLIKEGKSETIGSERLRGILDVLPVEGEVGILEAYDGELSKLGSAEQFCKLVLGVSSYRLRAEVMFLKEDFSTAIAEINKNLDTILAATEDFLTNTSFHSFLAFVLSTGNFLNTGSYAGNAAGFKIQILEKLYDTKSNKPRMTLMHFIVDVVELENPHWLSFITDFKNLPIAARLSLEQVSSEAAALSKNVDKMAKQVESAGKTSPDILTQFGPFITLAQEKLKESQDKVLKTKELEQKLAQQFGEDLKKFCVDEFFKSMNQFCEKLKTTKIENEDRRKREARQAALKAKEAQSGKKDEGKEVGGIGGSKKLKSRQMPLPDEKSVVDKLLDDIRKGSFDLKRTRPAG